MDNRNNQKELDLGLILKSRSPHYSVSFPIGNEKTKEVPLSSIKYIKAEGEISCLHTTSKDKPKVKIAQKLGEAEAMLKPFGFVRTHRSYLVNLSAVDPKTKLKDQIKLSSGGQLPIARRKKADFQNLLNRLGWTK